MADTVSIVIPAYNAAGTIVPTLESCALRENAEILVVDDGSTDNTADLARQFGRGVRVISGPNRGVSAARNRGIAETTGEWIIFLDADDQLSPDTIEERLTVAAEVDVVICRWQELIGDESMKGELRNIDSRAIERDAEIATAAYVWAPPAAILYRRGLVEKIGGFRQDLPILQDARFLFDAAYHGARFAFLEHVGALYRIHPQSLSRRDPGQFWRDCYLNGTQIETLWGARGLLSDDQRKALACIYGYSVRGLFAAASPEYFDAVARQRTFDARVPRHTRVTEPLARLFGLHSARRLLKLVGR